MAARIKVDFPANQLLVKKEDFKFVIPIVFVGYRKRADRSRRISSLDSERAKEIVREDWTVLAMILHYHVNKPFNDDPYVEGTFDFPFVTMEEFCRDPDRPSVYAHFLGRIAFFGIERMREYYAPRNFNYSTWWEDLGLEHIVDEDWEEADGAAEGLGQVAPGAPSHERPLNLTGTDALSEGAPKKGTLQFWDFLRLATFFRFRRIVSFDTLDKDCWAWNDRLIRLFEWSKRNGHIRPWKSREWLNDWEIETRVARIELAAQTGSRLPQAMEEALSLPESKDWGGDPQSRKEFLVQIWAANKATSNMLELDSKSRILPLLSRSTNGVQGVVHSLEGGKPRRPPSGMLDRLRYFFRQATMSLSTNQRDEQCLLDTNARLLDCLNASLRPSSIADQWWIRFYLSSVSFDLRHIASLLGTPSNIAFPNHQVLMIEGDY
ncbi:uncharacterized protein Z519_05981 [Cladophialophora bantiana CBS 173.52]|uniref:Uncharacterized protein n=1 Tax=Cladophialophora bantiana (strain ATCC 10958 / CBS 173.52 / CDC B-1940 / NIH 8579) TaxID=1442370 RepID=A0A0D2EU21_CLAB1|nr:uncharacterized protein Z519_05981 [Cladophialophora bantiana CBS 173.52]KIW93376.1 hypothetical protein Z519_05981 [Cladophialophora bantiana CBS 173.52]